MFQQALALTMNNLASLSLMAGAYAQAETLYQQAPTSLLVLPGELHSHMTTSQYGAQTCGQTKAHPGPVGSNACLLPTWTVPDRRDAR
jgi:hypothetical protein